VGKIYLTGYTAVPPRREISKTALGADEWIEWEYEKDPIVVIKRLKDDGWKIVSLELSEGSTKLNDYRPDEKVCFVLGHEVKGVPKELIEASDQIVEIPMLGKKESLNVAVSAGIVLYHLRNG